MGCRQAECNETTVAFSSENLEQPRSFPSEFVWPISILVRLFGVGALVQLGGVVQRGDHARNGRGGGTATNCRCSLLLQTLRRLPFVTPTVQKGPKRYIAEILVTWKSEQLFPGHTFENR